MVIIAQTKFNIEFPNEFKEFPLDPDREIVAPGMLPNDPKVCKTLA